MTRDQAIELIRQRHHSIADVLDEIARRTQNGEFGGKELAKVDRIAQGEETIRLVLEKFSKDGA